LIWIKGAHGAQPKVAAQYPAYTENEQIAVADNFVASTAIYCQQVSGAALRLSKAASYLPSFLSEPVVKYVLAKKAVVPDETSMYLYTNNVEMIWPYDDQGRAIGENVYEPDPDEGDIIKPTHLEDARRVIEEYIANLHEIIKKLRQKMN
jgi:hypothetical protein